MLRHIVMYKFKAEAQGRTREENLAIAQKLAQDMAVPGAIPELKAFQYGIGAPGSAEGNYDITLVCDLDSFAALDRYKLNPVHKAFGEHCHAVSDLRAAIDFEV